MRTIHSIDSVERKKSKNNTDYVVITVTLDDGTEAEFFLGVGNTVNAYHDEKWDKIKINKT